jgi:peptide/nickel transport system permease protein
MLRFLVRRLIQALVIVLVVATVTFALVHFAPGDPFSEYLNAAAVSTETVDRLREMYGLDRPLVEQYVRYLGALLRGDLGVSFANARPVVDILADAIPNTLILMLTALGASFLLGVAIGAYQASHRDSLIDRVLTSWTVVASALPEFWVALGAMAILAPTMELPVSGMTEAALHRYLSPMGKALDIARHLVLPAGTLVVILGAAIARFQRVAMIEAFPQDFVRTARAKGVSRRIVVYRHVLRNALLPIVTLVGLALPTLFGGAVFIENIFDWPGMGRVAVEALVSSDYPVVLGCVLLTTLLVAVGSMAADLLAAYVDPRVRDA